MMRKIGFALISTVIVVALVLLPFPRQTHADDMTSSPITITVWHSEYNPTVLNQIAADFHALHPDITVQLQYKDINDLYTQYIQAHSTGGGPNLVRGPNDWMGFFASRGLVEPVDTEFDLNLFVPEAKTATFWESQHWAVPDTYGNHLMLFYNKNILVTPPTNTDEMITIAKSLTGDGQFGLVYNLKEPFWLIPWLTGYGGWVLDESSDPIVPTLNTNSMINALQFVHDIRWIHNIVPPGTIDYNTADMLFREGKAAMLINGDWSLQGYRDYFGASLGIASIPLVSSTSLWPQPMTGGKFYYFNSNNSLEAKAASKLFVQYTSAKSPQLLWAQQQSILPVLLEAMNDPIVQADPILKGSADQALKGRLMPNVPEMGCVWESMYGPISAIMDGANSPTAEQAAADMQAYASECINELHALKVYIPLILK
ncbi:MAG: extracellular solute-binding protein [Anaerolineaceae bacterium]